MKAKGKFKIVEAPERMERYGRSAELTAFIRALQELQPGKALLVTASELGWNPDIKSINGRINHLCKYHKLKVFTETQTDGSVKVWRQQSEGVGLWERQS